MQQAPRCGAKTRRGTPSQSPAMPLPDARRAISGAPNGNQNAFKHGHYSAASIVERRQLAELIKAMREMANLVD